MKTRSGKGGIKGQHKVEEGTKSCRYRCYIMRGLLQVRK